MTPEVLKCFKVFSDLLLLVVYDRSHTVQLFFLSEYILKGHGTCIRTARLVKVHDNLLL